MAGAKTATDQGIVMSLSSMIRDFSAEVTAPDRKSLDAAANLLAPGSRVYIASLPSDTPEKLVSAAKRLVDASLVPVPHIVARNVKDRQGLDMLLGALTQEAGVDRALILGGDRDDPAGEYDCALQLIQSGLLSRHGIKKIALGTYPEGHPRISDETLEQALVDKLAAADAEGLETVLISQVCFDAKPIVQHLKKLRSMGIQHRIRVGVAGPAKRTTLLKYALICGVGPSLRGLKERQGLAKNLASGETPEQLIRDLDQAQQEDPSLNIWGMHFFTFAAFKNTIDFAAQYTDISVPQAV